MTTPSNKNNPTILFIALGVLGVLLVITILLVQTKDKNSLPASDRNVSASNLNQNVQTSSTNHPFTALEGKWARTDGDYIIVIERVDANGHVTAGYFNPQPIKVSKASANEKEGKAHLFLELQDVGYPGCTYNLALNKETEQMFGQYFQAAMRETYEVVFQKIKE